MVSGSGVVPPARGRCRFVWDGIGGNRAEAGSPTRRRAGLSGGRAAGPLRTAEINASRALSNPLGWVLPYDPTRAGRGRLPRHHARSGSRPVAAGRRPAAAAYDTGVPAGAVYPGRDPALACRHVVGEPPALRGKHEPRRTLASSRARCAHQADASIDSGEDGKPRRLAAERCTSRGGDGGDASGRFGSPRSGVLGCHRCRTGRGCWP